MLCNVTIATQAYKLSGPPIWFLQKKLVNVTPDTFLPR